VKTTENDSDGIEGQRRRRRVKAEERDDDQEALEKLEATEIF